MTLEKTNTVVIDLTGPDGNAYSLMGYANRWSLYLGLDGPSIIREMTRGDYENLLKVFDSYFGDYIILER